MLIYQRYFNYHLTQKINLPLIFFSMKRLFSLLNEHLIKPSFILLLCSFSFLKVILAINKISTTYNFNKCDSLRKNSHDVTNYIMYQKNNAALIYKLR